MLVKVVQGVNIIAPSKAIIFKANEDISSIKIINKRINTGRSRAYKFYELHERQVIFKSKQKMPWRLVWYVTKSIKQKVKIRLLPIRD